MDRPALKRLLADIEAGKVDCIVAYKVDRLSRSLLDFAQLPCWLGGRISARRSWVAAVLGRDQRKK